MYSAALYKEQVAMHQILSEGAAFLCAGSQQDHVRPVVEILHNNLAACQFTASPGMPLAVCQLERPPVQSYFLPTECASAFH